SLRPCCRAAGRVGVREGRVLEVEGVGGDGGDAPVGSIRLHGSAYTRDRDAILGGEGVCCSGDADETRAVIGRTCDRLLQLLRFALILLLREGDAHLPVFGSLAGGTLAL